MSKDKQEIIEPKVSMDKIEDKIVFREGYTKEDWIKDKKIGNLFLKMAGKPEDKIFLVNSWMLTLNDLELSEQERSKQIAIVLQPFINLKSIKRLGKEEWKYLIDVIGENNMRSKIKHHWRTASAWFRKK